MYYEATIKHDTLTDDGKVKTVSSKIIINNVNLFAEAELAALKYASSEWTADNFKTEPDVTALKRSRIYEFANKPAYGDKIYLATIDDIFVDDNGKEKAIHYLVGIYGDDITKAKNAASEYMKQGLNDMTLVGINETKFECVVDA